MQGDDLPLFSGTAPAAHIEPFKQMDEAALPQVELFPRPPVEMKQARRVYQVEQLGQLLDVNIELDEVPTIALALSVGALTPEEVYSNAI